VTALNLDTTYARRDQTLPKLVDVLSAFVNGRTGNYLVFFPSYQYMTKSHALFQEKNPHLFSPMQSSGMGERDRKEFLAYFNGEHADGMAAFAVMGGIFGEGIDLVGEKVIGVAIVGAGIPQIGLERSLVQQYHDDREEPGYDYSYTIPGFNRVMQAVGRLIRTESDRGVVLLADRRFGWQKYMDLMPQWWQPVAFANSARDVDRQVRSFWDRF
jgi:Rad3-related DNA helicase